MKVNLNVQLKDLKDQLLFEQEWSVGHGKMVDIETQPVLAKDKVCLALLTQSKDNSEEQYKQYKLFRKVFKTAPTEEVEVSSDEIVLIKKCLEKLGLPLILGQCVDILEGKTD